MLRMPCPSQDEEFRDFQVEVDEQWREPYQNADQVADHLVHMGRVLPECTPPPDYDELYRWCPYDTPPSYD